MLKMSRWHEQVCFRRRTRTVWKFIPLKTNSFPWIDVTVFAIYPRQWTKTRRSKGQPLTPKVHAIKPSHPPRGKLVAQFVSTNETDPTKCRLCFQIIMWTGGLVLKLAGMLWQGQRQHIWIVHPKCFKQVCTPQGTGFTPSFSSCSEKENWKRERFGRVLAAVVVPVG